MEKYTIKPIARLLQQQPRAAYSYNDFAQLETRGRKSGQAPPAPVEKIYQAILTELKNNCARGKKITRQQVIDLVDRYIKEHDLHFVGQRAAIAHKNYFSPAIAGAIERYDLAYYHPASSSNEDAHHHYKVTVPLEKLKTEIINNLAENPSLAKTVPGNNQQQTHEIIEKAFTDFNYRPTVDLDSVFYFRCEESATQLLIGNLQIDYYEKDEKGAGLLFNQTLGRPRNIYKALVQEAIKWSLTKPEKKIIFHAGYANQLAQLSGLPGDFQGRELITKKNLAVQQKNYTAWQKQLAALRPGDIIYRPDLDDPKQLLRGIVIESSAQRVRYYDEATDSLILQIYNLSYTEGFRSGITLKRVEKDLIKKIDLAWKMKREGGPLGFDDFSARADTLAQKLNFNAIVSYTYGLSWNRESEDNQKIHKIHSTHYVDLVRAYILRDAPRMLSAINKIFDYVVKIDPKAARKEKITYLENFLKSAPPNPGEYSETSRIMSGPGPHPSPPVSTTPPVYKLLQPFLYKFDYHKLLLEKFSTLRQISGGSPAQGLYNDPRDTTRIRIIPQPNLGGLIPKTFKYPAGEKPCYPVYPRGDLYNWYEDTLRQIFKELDLTFKQIPMVSTKTVSKYATAYGWEITTPREELRQRQIVSL